MNEQRSFSLRAKLLTWTTLAAATLVALPVAGETLVVPGERYEPAAGQVEVRNAGPVLRREEVSAPIFQRFELDPMPAAPAFQPRAKMLFAPLQVGVHRDLPAGMATTMDATSFDWEEVAGGQVATFAVRTPGARAVRLSLDFRRLPRGTEVRFYSPAAPERAMGPYSELASGGSFTRSGREPYWSPVIDGDEVAVELFVPGRLANGSVSLALRRVSHLTRHPLAPRDLSNVGASDSCQRDIACFGRHSDVADSVAKIIFEENGGTFLCSGQLMADTDPDTSKPFFSTAAHCISRKAAARSAVFFWFFQRARCDGADPTSVVQTVGGARLRVTTGAPGNGSLTTDFTLLQLRRMPPAGVTFGGWRVTDPEDEVDNRIHGVHHPSGDVKMGSRGQIIDLAQIDENGNILSNAQPYTHYVVRWNRGVTEGGSSGSSIWVGRRWPNQFILGPLTGGFSFCTARRDPDFYGIFAVAFNEKRKIRRLLAPN